MSETEWTCSACGEVNSTWAEYCNCETCSECGVYDGHDGSCKHSTPTCQKCEELQAKVAGVVLELINEKKKHLKDHGFSEMNTMIGGYAGGLDKAIKLLEDK